MRGPRAHRARVAVLLKWEDAPTEGLVPPNFEMATEIRARAGDAGRRVARVFADLLGDSRRSR